MEPLSAAIGNEMGVDLEERLGNGKGRTDNESGTVPDAVLVDGVISGDGIKNETEIESGVKPT